MVHGQLVRFRVQRQPDLRGCRRAGNVADIAIDFVAGDALGGCQQVFAVVLVVDVGGLGAVVVGRRTRVVGVGVGVGIGGIGSRGVVGGCGVSVPSGGIAVSASGIADGRRYRARGGLRTLQVLGALRVLSAKRCSGPFATRHDLRAHDEHPAIGGIGSAIRAVGHITVSGIAGISGTAVSRTGSVRPQALTRRSDGFRTLRKTGHRHQARRQNARQRHRRPATPHHPPRAHARRQRLHALLQNHALRRFPSTPITLPRVRIGTNVTGPATPFRSHSSLLPVSAPGSNYRPPTQRAQTSNPPCIILKTCQNN